MSRQGHPPPPPPNLASNRPQGPHFSFACTVDPCPDESRSFQEVGCAASPGVTGPTDFPGPCAKCVGLPPRSAFKVGSGSQERPGQGCAIFPGPASQPLAVRGLQAPGWTSVEDLQGGAWVAAPTLASPVGPARPLG